MKSRGSNNDQHVETHGPNNAAWDASLAERQVEAVALRAIARRFADIKDRYAGIVWKYKLDDWNVNGIYGVSHAYGVRRLHRGIQKSLDNLIEELES